MTTLTTEMMNYFELINRYWDAAERKTPTLSDTVIYLLLLHTWNRSRRNPFGLRTSAIEKKTGLSRVTIAAARRRLSQQALIRFADGSRNLQPIYLICDADITDSQLMRRLGVNTELNTRVNTQLNTNITYNNKQDISTTPAALAREGENIKSFNNENEPLAATFGPQGFRDWKESICRRFKIPEENLPRLAEDFCLEARCRSREIGPHLFKATRSYFTTWLERRLRSNRGAAVRPNQTDIKTIQIDGKNFKEYRQPGIGGRGHIPPAYGLIIEE